MELYNPEDTTCDGTILHSTYAVASSSGECQLSQKSSYYLTTISGGVDIGLDCEGGDQVRKASPNCCSFNRLPSISVTPCFCLFGCHRSEFLLVNALKAIPRSTSKVTHQVTRGDSVYGEVVRRSYYGQTDCTGDTVLGRSYPGSRRRWQ